jgi:hypothetical protein
MSGLIGNRYQRTGRINGINSVIKATTTNTIFIVARLLNTLAVASAVLKNR